MSAFCRYDAGRRGKILFGKQVLVRNERLHLAEALEIVTRTVGRETPQT
jgi:hypothetical protein